jgi:hypothetical protein
MRWLMGVFHAIQSIKTHRKSCGSGCRLLNEIDKGGFVRGLMRETKRYVGSNGCMERIVIAADRIDP